MALSPFPTLQFGSKFRGIKISANYPVAVVGNGGYEYRTLRFGYSRLSWSISARALTWQDKETLLSFYNQMGGTLKSFLYTDPEHNSVNGFALTADASGNYPVVVPIAGVLHPLFHTDGLTLTGGGTFALVNGFPVITGATSAPTLTGTFSLAARFDMTAGYALANAVTPTLSAAQMDEIKLIEVFE